MRKVMIILTLVLTESGVIAQRDSDSPTAASSATQKGEGLGTGGTSGVPPATSTSASLPDGLFATAPNSARGSGNESVGRLWLRGEYLLSWTKGGYSPPLITTGSASATSIGALGEAGTRVIYGDSANVDRLRSGARFTGGVWLDPEQTIALEGSYFFLGKRNSTFDASSNGLAGSQLIARPYFDQLLGAQNARAVASPSSRVAGDIHAATYSRLQGIELNVISGSFETSDFWVRALLGVRSANLEDGLSIFDTSRANSALVPGGSYSSADHFDTRNTFYGGQIGLQTEVRRGKLFVDVQSKIAFGVTHQVLDAYGTTAIASPVGTTALTPVGFLALGSNGGHYTLIKSSVIPEVQIHAGIQLSERVRAFLGYNYMYWSAIVRPGEQIDPILSGTQIPTDPRFNPSIAADRPAASISNVGFWMQGINLGLEMRY